MGKDKQVTFDDIARKLKIFPATVNRGLKDHPGISKKTKKKIFDLADHSGYRSNHFARNLRQRRTPISKLIEPSVDYPGKNIGEIASRIWLII